MNSRLFRTAVAAVTATFALVLAGCTEINGDKANEVAGDVGDAIKGDKTTYLASAQVAAVRAQENNDAGLKAVLASGYEPIAFVTKQDNTTFVVLRVCDGKDPKACMNAMADPAHPVVHLHTNSQIGKGKVDFNQKYALVYPIVGGRHGGVNCTADASTSTGTGLDGTAVGDMVDIGKAVDKQFADAVNGAEQAVKIGQASYDCTAELV